MSSPKVTFGLSELAGTRKPRIKTMSESSETSSVGGDAHDGFFYDIEGKIPFQTFRGRAHTEGDLQKLNAKPNPSPKLHRQKTLPSSLLPGAQGMMYDIEGKVPFVTYSPQMFGKNFAQNEIQPK